MMTSYSITPDQHAFQKQMWVLKHQFPVLACSRFRFIGVGNKITWLASTVWHETPLQTCGESCSASSANTGILNCLNNFFRLHPKDFFQSPVTAGFFVPFQRLAVFGVSYVFEKDKGFFSHILLTQLIN